MRPLFSSTLLVTAVLTLSRAAQIPFLNSEVPAHDAASQTIGILSHPSFPAHTLRFIQPPGEICESHKGTRSWSGYLDVNLDELWKHKQIHGEAADEDAHPEGVIEHFWFWAFESRSNPKEDPTVMWLNGGPGCECHDSSCTS
jgi:cathepsin A (carboxypeptidase C)